MFGENELNLAVEIDAASCRQLRLSVASRWIGPGTLRTGAASRRGCVIMAASSKGLCCPPSGVPCVRAFSSSSKGSFHASPHGIPTVASNGRR
jgi:hypothetical protein